MTTRHLTRIAVKLIKLVTHPVLVFVALQIVWITILVLWVFWFLSQQETLARLSKIIGASTTFSPATGIFTLVVGCVLLGIILVGTVVLFVFTQIQSSLLRQQKSFVSSVTHELRSPLSSLQLSFETLQRRQLTQDVRERIFGMVEKDLERLAQLVERILIASRLDRGIIDYKAQQDEIELRELLVYSVSQLDHLNPQAEKRIIVDCSPTLTIKSSRLGLTMVVGNLLENALKYSPASSLIHVRVQIKEYELWISFEDSGIGLSKNEQRKIFRMFHRSPRAEKQAVPGTGIGLYIVRSIVQSLGGRVWAQSEGQSRGSVFTVAFSRECILSY
jgi:signal transduction histidine kinase